MKNKALFSLLAISMLALTGCQDPTTTSSTPEESSTPVESSTPEFNATSLDVVKSSYANNQEVQVEGIVYGVTSNGFFVTDSAKAGIFVNMGDNWQALVSIGNKVQIDGKFSLVSGYCMIKQATVKVVSENETVPVTSAEKEFAFINDLTASASGDYGMLVKLTGNLTEGSGGSFELIDDAGNVLVLAANSAALLQSYAGKRISLEAIVYKKDSSGTWQLVFAGDQSDIVEAALTFDNYFALAKEELDLLMPESCVGNLNLPQGHNVDTTMTYTWAVKSGTSVSIVENNAVVVAPEADEEVVLTVTVTKGEDSRTIDYTIISKAIVEQTVAQFMENEPLDGDGVKVTGVVVAMGRNQGSTSEPYSASKRYVIIQDEQTQDRVPVDYYYSSTNHAYETIEVGDKVIVTGSYSNKTSETSNPSISATGVALVASDLGVSASFDSAVVLNSEETYEDLASNPNNYTGKLLKFENPYLAYSTSGEPNPSNWVRFGYDANVAKVANRSLATLIGLGNENVCVGWDEYFDIPYSGQQGLQIQGDIYAYLVYRSASYLQLCIPNANYIQFDDENEQLLFNEYASLPETIDSKGQLVLKEGLTYSFEDGVEGSDIIDSSGKVGTALANMDVTVTVSKVVGEKTYSFTKNITVISATTYSLSLVESANGTTTLSKQTGLLEEEEVTLTFAPLEGYVVVSYTIKTGDVSTTIAAYNLTESTFAVQGNSEISVEYGLASDYAVFTITAESGVGSALLWYGKDGSDAWSSSTSGNTARDYEYVMGRIADIDGNKIDPTIFSVAAKTAPSLNGKWANFNADSSSYEGKEMCIYGCTDETSAIVFTSTLEIYCVRITFVNATNANTRSAVYAAEKEVHGQSESSTVKSYAIYGNTFEIVNTGYTYLYFDSVEIVYKAPANTPAE